MYQRTYIIPNNSTTMYRNNPNNLNSPHNSDDRFLLTPFLFGGLAGTALGFGIANNNQINRPIIYPQYVPMPYYPNQNFYPNNTNNCGCNRF